MEQNKIVHIIKDNKRLCKEPRTKEDSGAWLSIDRDHYLFAHLHNQKLETHKICSKCQDHPEYALAVLGSLGGINDST